MEKVKSEITDSFGKHTKAAIESTEGVASVTATGELTGADTGHDESCASR